MPPDGLRVLPLWLARCVIADPVINRVTVGPTANRSDSPNSSRLERATPRWQLCLDHRSDGALAG